MVKKPEVKHWHIENRLRSINAGLSELFEPEARRWMEEDKRNHYLRKQEWHNDMGALELLEETYKADKMTPEQKDRYNNLKRQLKESLPILKQLRFTLPPVSL